MKRAVLLLLAAGFACIAAAQNTERPGWTYNTPKAGNSTYVYVVERGGGTTVNEAINNALAKVLRTTMMRIGAVVSWDEVNNALQNGTDWGTVAMKYNIPVNKVCECVEQKTEKGYRVSVLCQVAKSGAVYPDFDEFTACNDTRQYSDGTALLKSAFIPGLGQMGKNHTYEGYITMGTEVLFLSVAIGTYFGAQKKLDILQDYNVTFGDYFAAKQSYETYRTANIVCLSAAGALYVYNLVRAYTLIPKYKKRSLSFAPAIMPVNDGLASGVNLTFNF
ncbi:MAG: hypothetical protein J6X35_05360 [Bacteroidales bacterium]|nr:hypothetical protein [Bacteroidales bacterium]